MDFDSNSEEMAGEQREELGAWEYLGYQLIVRIKEQNSRQISRSKFLKLNCVADRYLQSELNVDISLPRYWYKYGEIMDESSLNGEFYHAPAARGYSGQQYLTSREYSEDEFEISSAEQEAIEEAAKWTALKFAKKNAEQIKRFQYQAHAPKEFIRSYSELRDRLENPEQSRLSEHASGPSSMEEVITDLLDEMLLSYPKKEYSFIYDSYLIWDDTARIFAEDGENFEALGEFLDRYITSLSKIELRFRHGQNIPDYRSEKWSELRDEELNGFSNYLYDVRDGLLSGHESQGLLDSVAEEYNESVANLIGLDHGEG